VFLRAAALVAADLPNVDFLVVGDGPEREPLEALAHDLRLTGQVVFAGQRRDVPDVLAALDLFVAPSREESFGLAALEAIAAGVPLVASDVGGLSEILAGTDLGDLVAPGDPEALAEVIRRELNTVSLADEGAGEGTELTDGGLLSLADMLVKETEFDLDQTGLAASAQPHAGEHETAREALLARFDLGRMAAQTAELYEELVCGKAD
jgi:glycosyltransferase involved in cell wall biosynthesis